MSPRSQIYRHITGQTELCGSVTLPFSGSAQCWAFFKWTLQESSLQLDALPEYLFLSSLIGGYMKSTEANSDIPTLSDPVNHLGRRGRTNAESSFYRLYRNHGPGR